MWSRFLKSWYAPCSSSHLISRGVIARLIPPQAKHDSSMHRGCWTRPCLFCRSVTWRDITSFGVLVCGGGNELRSYRTAGPLQGQCLQSWLVMALLLSV